MKTVDSIDDECHSWHKLVSLIIEKHLPVKGMRATEKDAPYMTLARKQVINKERRYAKQYGRENNEENKELRNKWRSKATREMRQAITADWKNYLKK